MTDITGLYAWLAAPRRDMVADAGRKRHLGYCFVALLANVHGAFAEFDTFSIEGDKAAERAGFAEMARRSA
jgi:hypothetical protein